MEPPTDETRLLTQLHRCNSDAWHVRELGELISEGMEAFSPAACGEE
jgi:hypothetical protein